MIYRWLTPEEILTLANPVLQFHGWAQLNVPTSQVLGAFADDGLPVELFVLQLFPILGPLVRVDNERRDNGEISRALATKMQEFLEANEARGCMAIADSPITERLCERFEMKKLDVPVYVWKPEPAPSKVA